MHAGIELSVAHPSNWQENRASAAWVGMSSKASVPKFGVLAVTDPMSEKNHPVFRFCTLRDHCGLAVFYTAL